MSVCTTWPLAPTFLAKASARSPVPPAMSSTCWPGAHVRDQHGVGLPGAMQAHRHQVVHQVVARRDRVEHAAHAARLLALVDRLEAEVGLAHVAIGAPVSGWWPQAAAWPHAAAIGASRSTPASAQAPLVVGPQLVLLRAQVVQVVPGEDAGVVAIGEGRLHGVVADRLERRPDRPRACRSAAPPGPGRGPAPRPRANTCASARTECGTSAPSEKPTSSTRDCWCTVIESGVRRVGMSRPAMARSRLRDERPQL